MVWWSARPFTSKPPHKQPGSISYFPYFLLIIADFRSCIDSRPNTNLFILVVFCCVGICNGPRPLVTEGRCLQHLLHVRAVNVAAGPLQRSLAVWEALCWIIGVWRDFVSTLLIVSCRGKTLPLFHEQINQPEEIATFSRVFFETVKL